MKKIISCILLLLILNGCTTSQSSHFNAVIEGDIDKIELINFEAYKIETFEYKDQKLKGVKLNDIINLQDIYSILVMSNDGAMAKIDGDMSDSYLYFDENYGLCIVNVNHPINGNIKDIYRIVVESSVDSKMLIIDDGELNQYSMLDFYIQQPNISIKDGQSSQNDNQTEVFVKRVTMELQADNPYVVFAKDGQQTHDYQGYIQIIDNSFVYVSANGQRLFDVVGVLFDAPYASISDVYDLVLDYIDKNKVMVIEVDGLGYHMIDDTKLPLEKAISVYPSISNVALASILSGELPNNTQINQRKDRELELDTIFDYALSKKYPIAYIEGDSSLIKTSVEPKLNIDKNNQNGTDDEVYQATLEAIEDNNHLIFTHFHGVDDIAHKYGPESMQTKDKWYEIQIYIDELIEVFNGTIIIVSDHGQHSSIDGGNHGTCQSDDIIGVIGVIQN